MSAAKLNPTPMQEWGLLSAALKCISKLQCHPRNSCSEVAGGGPASLFTSLWPGQGSQASVPRRRLSSAGHLMSSSSLMMLLYCAHLHRLLSNALPSSLIPPSSFPSFLSASSHQLSPFLVFPFFPTALPWLCPGEAAHSWKELWLPCPA